MGWRRGPLGPGWALSMGVDLCGEQNPHTRPRGFHVVPQHDPDLSPRTPGPQGLHPCGSLPLSSHQLVPSPQGQAVPTPFL